MTDNVARSMNVKLTKHINDLNVRTHCYGA